MKRLKTHNSIDRVSDHYPLIFPAIFDLMPLMSFQKTVDPNLLLREFIGVTSVQIGASKGDIIKSKEHDLIIKIQGSQSENTEMIFDGNPTTQKKLWEQFADMLGTEIDEINTNLRVPVIKTPNNIDVPFDSLWFIEAKTGTHTRSLKRRLGLTGVRNHYHMIKNELLEKGLWQKPYSKKLRGIMKTINLAGISEKKLVGWQKSFTPPERHRFNPLLNKLYDAIIENKWWQDNGTPICSYGSSNSIEIEATTYLLRKHNEVIIG